jgi:protein-L-isoaspartate(D-aspartate) O-methyltransferase
MDFETQRRNMIESQVRPSDVTDRRIISAMSKIPREAFVPEQMRSFAYMDTDVRLGGVRGLMAPRIFAKLLQLAQIEPGDLVLDLGSATGYSPAVIAELGAAVVALECDAGLAEQAKTKLAQTGASRINIVAGDLASGYPEEAPYDAIVVEGALPEVPRGLLEQLKDGGRLVAVVTRDPGQRILGKAAFWIRNGGSFAGTTAFDASAPALPGFERAAVFAL